MKNKKEILEEIFRSNSGDEIVEEDGFNYWSFDNPLRLLETVLVYGEKFEYIFHGSTIRIVDQVIPKPALDMLREQGRRTAIYATANIPWAMFWAVTGGIKEKRRKVTGKFSIDENKKVSYSDVQFTVEDLNQVKDFGWIYIFENSGWEYSRGEYLSYDPKNYLAVIKIKREDFKFPLEVKEIPRITYQNN